MKCIIILVVEEKDNVMKLSMADDHNNFMPTERELQFAGAMETTIRDFLSGAATRTAESIQ